MRILPNAAEYRRLGLISLCILSLMTPGCGQKVFPTPQGGPPPPQVKNLKALVVLRCVELSWSPIAVGTVKGITYTIMRSELKWENRNCLECPAPDLQRVQSIDAASAKPDPDGQLRWVDTDVSFQRAFRYQIAMVNAKGDSLSLSNPVTAKVYPGPMQPVNIAAEPQPNGILIRWKPTLKDIEGASLDATSVSFIVERLSSKKGWEKASPAPVKGDAYYDQSVASEQDYSYRIVPLLFIDGVYAYGEPSHTVLARAPGTVAPPPPGKVWITPSPGALEVHWVESGGKTAGYQVYRREGKEIIRLTASPVQCPPFIDHGVKKGATYFYAVSAVSTSPDHKEGLLSKWIEYRNLISE